VLAYLPMRVELPVVMLACARLGAVHSVVFGGFSSDAVAQRILDSKPAVVISGSSVKRGTKSIPLKSVVDHALEMAAAAGVHVKTVLVAANERAVSRADTPWAAGRDVWWDEALAGQPSSAPCAWVDAEHPLFMLYTSGSTGKPKGVVHSTGGYMVYSATTFKHAFDYQPGDVYWCTADCGWITGHSYLTYGPLLAGATQVVLEGVPTVRLRAQARAAPLTVAISVPGRGPPVAHRGQVRGQPVLHGPTAIRSLEKLGDSWLAGTSRASLRVLGSVGEPINPSAWEWYFSAVGGGRCPIVDTWWQTETGGHMIMPLPGPHALKPGSAALPFFGVVPALLDAATGVELPPGPGSGVLCIKAAWPGAARTLYGDQGRFEDVYYKPFPGYYYTSDGASSGCCACGRFVCRLHVRNSILTSQGRAATRTATTGSRGVSMTSST